MRLGRQKQLCVWHAVDLVLLCIIGEYTGSTGDNLSLLDLALEAGVSLLRDGCAEVQDQVWQLLNMRRYRDFNAQVCLTDSRPNRNPNRTLIPRSASM